VTKITFLALFTISVFLVGTIGIMPSFADVISPRQQMKLDFTAEQVICSEGLVKITKSFNSKVACVKPSTAEKLAKNGWAKQLSAETLEEIKIKIKNKGDPAGTIKKIATLKQLSKSPISGTSISISGYAYIFEACGTSKIIRTPEIFLTSDSETKSVKLGSQLKPDSCYTSSVIIKAADPNSISAELLNKGGITEKISTLESQIADLKSKISAAKQKIPKSEDQEPNSENISNIISMKKDLKELQDQLRRYLMVLYVPPSRVSEIDTTKSITGQPLDGMSTSLISLTESVTKPESENPDLKRYNVIFEACAGKDTVRLPIINIASDSDSVDVKLSERIIPESCQVEVTRINAIDSESISLKITGNSYVSVVIANIEKEIEQMQTDLADKRSKLGLLFAKQLDATGEKKAEKLASEISELRKDLLETKAKLYSVLLGV